jgi:tRNA A-37 threonylcarbamoyl transferase component Bud32
VVGPGLRARLAPGASLGRIAADGDPDHLLTDLACTIVKMQRKVIVGRIALGGETIYVKRYTVFAARVALASVWQRSPAFRAFEAAGRLAALGFATPAVVAAVERRRAGVLRKSFFLTREVEGAVAADVRWQAILGDPYPARRRAARRALARGLGELFARLHAAGVRHPDLKDANILVRGTPEAPAFVLLDLERVSVAGTVRRRQRVKNLVQLARTLGRLATATDRVRFLAAYLAAALGRAASRRERREWAEAVAAAVARKERGRAASVPRVARPPSVSCTVICQNEAEKISACLASVAWCDEIVVVDSGSTDGTIEIAHRYTDRVLSHAWPGHSGQKQFALDAARSEWVLNLDADERITPDLAVEVQRRLATAAPSVNGFAIPRLVCYLGRWWQHGALYPRQVTRLVRRSATRWGGTDPHERAEVSGAVERLGSPLLHYTYNDIADHLRSVNRLTDMAVARPVPPAPVGFARLVLAPGWRFARSYLVQWGFLDGFPGLFVAVTAAFYVFLRWAKEWERGASLDGPGAGS